MDKFDLYAEERVVTTMVPSYPVPPSTHAPSSSAYISDKGERPTERTFWHHPLHGGTSTEEALLTAVARDQAAHQMLHQDGWAGNRATYHAYHLTREVQQYHQRLFATQQLHVARSERLA